MKNIIFLSLLYLTLTTISAQEYNNRWEDEISIFDKSDKNNPAQGGVLFTGSSSIRFWKNLAEDFFTLFSLIKAKQPDTKVYYIAIKPSLARWEKTPNFRGFTPWILNNFRSPKRVLPIIQDGWNRKDIISNQWINKKAFFTVQSFYKKMKQQYK